VAEQITSGLRDSEVTAWGAVKGRAEAIVRNNAHLTSLEREAIRELACSSRWSCEPE